MMMVVDYPFPPLGPFLDIQSLSGASFPLPLNPFPDSALSGLSLLLFSHPRARTSLLPT